MGFFGWVMEHDQVARGFSRRLQARTLLGAKREASRDYSGGLHPSGSITLYKGDPARDARELAFYAKRGRSWRWSSW